MKWINLSFLVSRNIDLKLRQFYGKKGKDKRGNNPYNRQTPIFRNTAIVLLSLIKEKALLRYNQFFSNYTSRELRRMRESEKLINQ